MTELVSLEQVRAWLKPGSSNLGTGDDDLLRGLIRGASGLVLNYINREAFSVETYTETHDTGAVNFVSLREAPLVSVTSIAVIGGETYSAPCDPASPRPGQLLIDKQRVTVIGARFPSGRSTVLATYTAGYAEVPEDVQQIVIEMVGERYKSRDRIGIRSKSLPNGETVTYDRSMLSPLAIQALQPYMRVI